MTAVIAVKTAAANSVAAAAALVTAAASVTAAAVSVVMVVAAGDSPTVAREGAGNMPGSGSRRPVAPKAEEEIGNNLLRSSYLYFFLLKHITKKAHQKTLVGLVKAHT